MGDPPKNIPSQPSKSDDAPHPDEIPKLSQTIFNLEKKGGLVVRDQGAPGSQAH
jgi:hypothetical protein